MSGAARVWPAGQTLGTRRGTRDYLAVATPHRGPRAIHPSIAASRASVSLAMPTAATVGQAGSADAGEC